ncbi:tyrosine-protein phosphatase [uncultured Clostridium sp.]|uniref:tyrosine-protein phosphatase n=1 Tax=uncultured Clostridium sp. TaxID=59620 RepID=UPI00261F2524|nr:tyrosine-protein phosphatase [uncultured Clostridium sp.]
MERLKGTLVKIGENIKIVLNKEVSGELFYKNYLEDKEKFIKNIENKKEIVFKDIDINNRNFYIIKTENEELILAERLIPLKNFCNFRDLGGFYSKDGRMIKWGKLYRSEVLCNIEEVQMEYFKSLGIKYVFDYRSNEEEASAKDMQFPWIKNLHISAMNDENNENLDMEGYFYKFLKGEEKKSPVDLLKESYGRMPFNSEAYKTLVDTFKDYNNAAILQHCTAGKDRTGLGSAILLLILGVDEKIVIEDYMSSNKYRKEANEKIIDMYKDQLPEKAIEIFREIMGVKEEFIDESLNNIKEKYGTYDEYFLKEFNLTEKDIEDIRNEYLV